MAYLEINVGSKTSTITANETKAQNILGDVAALFELTGTAQEQLDAVAELIKETVMGWSRQYRERIAVDLAISGVETDSDYFWED